MKTIFTSTVVNHAGIPDSCVERGFSQTLEQGSPFPSLVPTSFPIFPSCLKSTDIVLCCLSARITFFSLPSCHKLSGISLRLQETVLIKNGLSGLVHWKMEQDVDASGSPDALSKPHQPHCIFLKFQKLFLYL